jgi:hypothetical protein
MPSAYKKGEFRIPKSFTRATNPRFAGELPDTLNPNRKNAFDAAKSHIIKLIRMNRHISKDERQAQIRAVYSAETPDQIEPYYPNMLFADYPDINQYLDELTRRAKANPRTYIKNKILHDIFNKDGTIKPGKQNLLDDIKTKGILEDDVPTEELLKFLPRQEDKGNINNADLRSKLNYSDRPKFKTANREYKKFIEETKAKKASTHNTEEELKRAHEEKVFRDALNPDAAAQEEARAEIDKNAAETKPIKSYVKELPAFAHQVALEQSHGTPAEQQFQHAMLEKTIDEMSKPYKPYTGNRIAERDPLEKLAMENIRENSPSSIKNLAHHEGQRKRIEALSNLPKQSAVAAPYLNRSAGNPLDVFKGQLDKDVMEKIAHINEDMDKKFKEEYLPRIERVNKIGPAKYGAVGKALERATAEHEKGKQRSIREAILENNRTALQAGQNYLGHHANLGEIASKNATQERGDEERASHFLAQQHQNEENEKEKFIWHLKTQGEVNREREQQVLNENFDEANRAKEHSYESMVKGMNIKSRMPQVPTAFQTRANIQPPISRPNINQQMGAGMMNMGANQLFRKKGGIVHVKKAQGGVIGEAVDNAVIEHSSPLYELKRLINKGNAMDISQTKIGKRRKYNAGGAVDPIQAGADQAAAFKEKDNLKNHLAQRQQPRTENPMAQMMNDFMVGVSSVGGDNTLGRVASAYKESAGQREASKDKAEQRQLQSLMADYQIANDSRKEDQMLKKIERDEKYRDKILKLKSDILNRKNTVASQTAPKIDEVDKALFKKTNDNLLKATSEIGDLKKLKDLVSKMSTGLFSSKYTGKGTKADKEEFDVLSASIFGKGGPTRNMDKKAINSVIEGKIKELEKQAELSALINENYKKGISPKDSLYEFQKNNSQFNLGEVTTAPVEIAGKASEKTAEQPVGLDIESAYVNDPIIQKLEAQLHA